MTVARTWSLRTRRPLPDGVSAGGRAVVERDRGDWRVAWRGCALMGIVNVTPDSFSDGGLYGTTERAVAHGRRLVADGALIVDVGGESTRPGALAVPIDVELGRVVPVIRALAADGGALISVDTTKPEVAAVALAEGAHLVNDVRGLRDAAMTAVCVEHGAAAVIMHMQGSPVDMQDDPHYIDVVDEVSAFLRERADAAVGAGVPSVLVDPGLGFGKTLAHNVALLRAMPLLEHWPMLIGASRKGMIRALSDADADQPRDAGSIAAHLLAAQRGAAMVRVHDVGAHRQALRVDAALRAEER